MRRLAATFFALLLGTFLAHADDWQTIKPDGLGFSIEFPVKPSVESRDVELSPGSHAKYRTFQILNENVIYDVTVIDYPAGSLTSQTPDQVIDTAQNGLVTDFPDAKIRSRGKTQLAGREAGEVLIDTMGMVVKGRMLVEGDRIYYVGTIARFENQTSPPVERFVGSFKLLAP